MSVRVEEGEQNGSVAKIFEEVVARVVVGKVIDFVAERVHDEGHDLVAVVGQSVLVLQHLARNGV